MNWKRIRYILIPRYLYYITGLALYEKVLDIIHFLIKKPPIWNDALWCGKIFCRYCGGKYDENNKE